MKKIFSRAALAALAPLCASHSGAAMVETDLPVDNLFGGQTLRTVVVTASQQPVPLREVAVSVSVLSAEDIEDSGQPLVSQLLSATPGINVSNNGGIGKTSALRIRGEESYRTLVLIDGMNVSDPTAPQISPRFEDLLSGGIERIEILRGPQGMMYGADAGGVVNILTRRAQEPFALDAAVEYGRYDTAHAFANVRGKNDVADYSLSATRFDNGGFNSRTTDTALRDEDGYENTTLHFNGGVQLNDALRLEVTLRDVAAENEYDGCYDPATFVTTHRCINEYDLTAYRVAAIYDSETLAQKLALQRSANERDDITAGVRNGRYEGEISEAQYQGIFRFANVGDIVYGADLKQDELKQPDEDRTERDQLGYYLEWQGTVDEKFFYTAGARHDDNDDFGDHTSYRISAAYVFDFAGDALKLKTSYGTGFRAPSPYEIAYNRGPFAMPPASTIELEEETSKGLDAGFEYHWKDAGYIEVVYFTQKIRDQITYDLANYSGYLQESGNTRSRGVEISGTYALSKTLNVLGNYTYNDTSDASGDQRIRRPRHIANIGFELRPLADVTVYTNMRIVRDSEDSATNPATFALERVDLDDYSALQASVNWAVNKQFDLYLRGENLLRDDYEEVTTYRTAKGAVYGGVRYRFR